MSKEQTDLLLGSDTEPEGDTFHPSEVIKPIPLTRGLSKEVVLEQIDEILAKMANTNTNEQREFEEFYANFDTV